MLVAVGVSVGSGVSDGVDGPVVCVLVGTAVGVLVGSGVAVLLGPAVGGLVRVGAGALATSVDQVAPPMRVAFWDVPALSIAVVPLPSSKRQLATGPAGLVANSVWKLDWIWVEVRTRFQTRTSSILPRQKLPSVALRPMS